MIVNKSWIIVKIMIRTHPITKLNHTISTLIYLFHSQLNRLVKLRVRRLLILSLTIQLRISKESASLQAFLIIIQFVQMTNLNLNSNFDRNNQIQNIQDADLRLQRTIELYQDTSRHLKIVQDQCDQIFKLESSLKQQHQTIKKSFLFNKVNNFQNWQSRLKKISSKILIDKTISEGQGKNNSKLHNEKVVCSQKKHLQDIFSRKQFEEQRKQIEKLESKLGDIYSKIQKCLQQQCLNEKVMSRIKKQSKRASKIKVLQFIDKQASQYKGWLQDNKTKLKNQLLEKQFQQKVVDNLQAMKQLVNKKIINNDYIYDVFGENSQDMLKVIENMDKFGQTIKQKCQQFNKQAKELYTNSYFNQKSTINALKEKKLKQPYQNIHQKTNQYFQHAQQVIKQTQSSEQYATLSQRCQKLKMRIDQIIKTSLK